jgi:pSer/pThr/pTyr-binding forkhead associated (FHA) protein
MAKNVLVLKHFESPKEAGVYYRLVCLTGANKGESYVLMGNRIVIGRSDKADIRLTLDSKTSREHAEITRVGDNWVATDLGSQNGVMVNEHKITQQTLNEGDKLIIGQTVFKFAKVEVSQKKVIKEKADSAASSKNQKTMLPMIAIAGILVMVFLYDDKPAGEKKKDIDRINRVQDVSNEFETALQKRRASEDKAIKEKLNIIYQRGLREYREGNYFRAIAEFNLALIMAPGDSQGEHYLRKTKEELDKAIEGFTVKAQRDEEALKYQSAIVAYCAIIRLLYSVPDDPRHKNAEKQILDLEAKLGLEPSETNCLKKQRTN